MLPVIAYDDRICGHVTMQKNKIIYKAVVYAYSLFKHSLFSNYQVTT